MASKAEVPFPDLTGYVLAGGESSRMGLDKAFLPVHGRPMLTYALHLLQSLCVETAVLGGPEVNVPRIAELERYARVVPDRVPGCGPLGGVDAALADAKTEWLLLVAVDQILLTPDILRPWIDTSLAADCLCSCMSLDGVMQPLPVLLRRTLQPAVEGHLRRGERKLMQTWRSTTAQAGGRCRVHALATTPDIARSFANLNTPGDLAEVEQNWTPPSLPNQNASEASE